MESHDRDSGVERHASVGAEAPGEAAPLRLRVVSDYI
jgi:hypothetical protein